MAMAVCRRATHGSLTASMTERMRVGRMAAVAWWLAALFAGASQAQAQARAPGQEHQSAPVAGVLGGKGPRVASTDPELEDLRTRLEALAQALREHAPGDARVEPTLAKGRAALEGARDASARGDRERLARHKQVGWAAVAVLARVLSLARETRALQNAKARAKAARDGRVLTEQALDERRTELAALRAQLEARSGAKAQETGASTSGGAP